MVNPLRIMHTEASPGWGGQEIRIMQEMRWFRERGHHLMLVAPAHSVLIEKATEEGFETATLLFTKNKILGDVLRLFGIIGKFKPDVVATHSSVDSWAGLIAAKLRRVKCRVRYRHVSTPVKDYFLNRWQYRSLCHLVLTTGECIRQPLLQKFSLHPDKVISAPTAVKPPDELISKSEARGMLQAELGLDSNARFMGQVSVLRSWKGHVVLMEAFSRIAEELPNHHLVFVGGGPIEGNILQMLQDDPLRDRIHLVGHKPNPWPYFRAFDVAVLASVMNEGIPQSLLQAMYSGVPVVGTDVGGIPEIVSDGSTGLLANPGDATSLAGAIIKLLEPKLKERLAESAKTLVQENFKWNALGEKIEGLFRRELKRS
jgi:glycosyltransferase involved in cell wall biosynthesis